MYVWGFWNQVFVFMSVLFYRVCTHLRLGVLESSLCVCVCVGVEGTYTCKTGNCGNMTFCLCFCCFIGRVHIKEL